MERIIIHVAEGSWVSALNWFADPNSGVSAHYLVRSSDGHVFQSVLERHIAHHAENWEYSEKSLGIEHEGYSAYPEAWFTEAMYRSSARLCAYLCEKYGIPVDRSHVIGHDQVPHPSITGRYGGRSRHADPGPYWDWEKYLGYVEGYYGVSS